jgi:hypothetical protein
VQDCVLRRIARVCGLLDVALVPLFKVDGWVADCARIQAA